MHLHEARLCLDCEELHTVDRCPHCASDAFAFLTQWIPIDERRRPIPRRVPPKTSPFLSRRWLAAGVGAAALAAARWWTTRASSPTGDGRTPTPRPPRRDDS